jgi:hypothetical protein
MYIVFTNDELSMPDVQPVSAAGSKAEIDKNRQI